MTLQHIHIQCLNNLYVNGTFFIETLKTILNQYKNWINS